MTELGVNHPKEEIRKELISGEVGWIAGSIKDIRSVQVGDTVTTIDSRAFAGCTNLRRLYLPDSVTTLGTDVFEGCDNITIIANKRTGANRLRCKSGEIPWYKEHLFMNNEGAEEGDE